MDSRFATIAAHHRSTRLAPKPNKWHSSASAKKQPWHHQELHGRPLQAHREQVGELTQQVALAGHQS
eukprot:7045500-Prorocentrum_lima.AAC.1